MQQKVTKNNLLSLKDKERINYDIKFKFDVLKRIAKNVLPLQLILSFMFYFIFSNFLATYLITSLLILLSLVYANKSLILRYIDLKRNIKIKVISLNYDFTEHQNDLFIMQSKDHNLKFDVFHEKDS